MSEAFAIILLAAPICFFIYQTYLVYHRRQKQQTAMETIKRLADTLQQSLMLGRTDEAQIIAAEIQKLSQTINPIRPRLRSH